MHFFIAELVQYHLFMHTHKNTRGIFQISDCVGVLILVTFAKQIPFEWNTLVIFLFVRFSIKHTIPMEADRNMNRILQDELPMWREHDVNSVQETLSTRLTAAKNAWVELKLRILRRPLYGYFPHYSTAWKDVEAQSECFWEMSVWYCSTVNLILGKPKCD